MHGGQVRWGIIGTGNIARASFLPGLREAGGGAAMVVASRERSRAERFASDHGVERAVAGYERVLEDRDVDAVYITLPNALHAEWTMRALAAGKTVLAEKPLCVSPEETKAVLAAAATSAGRLWEAFVFPFQAQFGRIAELLRDGAIGGVREIQSSFHFQVRSSANIRWSRELAGGALNDVGCYPVHLASLLFQSDADRAEASATWSQSGVDEAMRGFLAYRGGQALLFSCGMSRPYDTFTRILGSEGEIRVGNPYHPQPGDPVQLRRGGTVTTERPTRDQHSFSAAIRHIHAVLRSEADPRYLAQETALPTALALHALRTAAQRGL